MKKTSKSVDISLNGELSWPYLEMAKKKKKTCTKPPGMYSQYFIYEPGKEKDKKEIIFEAAVNGVTE